MPIPVPLIAAGLGALGQAAGIWSAHRSQDNQSAANMKIAKFQASANERYLDKYNAYNHPHQQMQRYKEAGLNPHLMYGQGTPGNQSQPLQYPNIERTDYGQVSRAIQAAPGEILPLINQTRLVDSQVQATNAKTLQSAATTELTKLQAEVVKRNPLLNDAGYKAIIDSLIWTANIKGTQSDIQSQAANFLIGRGQPDSGAPGIQKMQRELDLLEQRFHLGTLDAGIKAEVLKSKDFQNAILEVQKKFMTDGEITPQHILQFVQLLLMKAL